MYANDTNIFFTSHEITALETKVNNYLMYLYRWLKENMLELNSKKTTYMVFCPVNKLLHNYTEV